MPVLLLAIGVFAVVAGLAMVGFGIPINEFSFGNTLINAGTTASVGGLIIIAVGIAVRQLRRIVEMLADSAQTAGLARLAPPADEFEPGAALRKGAAAASAPAPAPGRAAFPPRPNERPMPGPFDIEPEPVLARAAHDLTRRPDGKLHLDRVRVRVEDGRLVCERSGVQASNVLSGMAAANGLALIPDGEGVRAGDELRVLLL